MTTWKQVRSEMRRRGVSMARMACHIGVSRRTLYGWISYGRKPLRGMWSPSLLIRAIDVIVRQS